MSDTQRDTVGDTLRLLDGLAERNLQASQVEVYSGRVMITGLVRLPPPGEEEPREPRRRTPRP